MSLLTNLVSHWRLDEASGTRVDVHGGNNLTSVNGVGQSIGIIGNAAHFTAASNQALTVADNASLHILPGDLTVAVWLYFDTITASQYAVQKGPSDALGVNFELGVGLRFWVSDGGSYVIVPDAAVGATPPTAAWLFIIGWYDQGANTVNICTNDGAVSTLSLGAIVPASGTGLFTLGAYQGTGQPMNGRIDSTSLWSRVLTAAERTSLYNGGIGFDYPFTVLHGGSFSDPARVIGSVDGYGSAAVTANQYLTEHVFAYPARLGGVQVHADTAGTGTGNTTVDVLLNGTSVYHQAGDRPTLSAGQTGLFYQANPPTTRAINRGDTLAIQVAAISSTGHARLKAHVAIERALQRGA